MPAAARTDEIVPAHRQPAAAAPPSAEGTAGAALRFRRDAPAAGLAGDHPAFRELCPAGGAAHLAAEDPTPAHRAVEGSARRHRDRAACALPLDKRAVAHRTQLPPRPLRIEGLSPNRCRFPLADRAEAYRPQARFVVHRAAGAIAYFVSPHKVAGASVAAVPFPRRGHAHPAAFPFWWGCHYAYRSCFDTISKVRQRKSGNSLNGKQSPHTTVIVEQRCKMLKYGHPDSRQTARDEASEKPMWKRPEVSSSAFRGPDMRMSVSKVRGGPDRPMRKCGRQREEQAWSAERFITRARAE
jgi:hypothetical protein